MKKYLHHKIEEKILNKDHNLNGYEKTLKKRILDENEIRKIKRLSHACPFNKNGYCKNIEIRCGERQQYGIRENAEEAQREHRCFYKPCHNMQDINVLIVDDDPSCGDLCSDFLGVCGINTSKITYAPSAEMAEEIITRGKIVNKQYQILISDIRLPNRTGFDLVHHIIERNFNTHIFLMTGFSETKDMPKFYLGDEEIVEHEPVVAKYFRKPIDAVAFFCAFKNEIYKIISTK